MVKHVDKHKHALEQLRIKDRYYDIDLPKAEDRLAPEIEEIWRSALDHFQMGTHKFTNRCMDQNNYATILLDLRRQKMQLSMELREELDVEKKKLTTNLEQDIQTIVRKTNFICSIVKFMER